MCSYHIHSTFSDGINTPEEIVLLSSDSHAVETLEFGFSEMKAYLKDIGFTHLMVYLDSQFQSVAIEKA